MNKSIFTNPDLRQKAMIVLGLSALMFGIEILNSLLGYSLLIFGIYPREAFGLIGIFTSPFIHANFDHFVSNIGPFIFLSAFIVWEGISHYIKISLSIMLSTGLMVWTMGPSASVIVGASGVIFGYLGYLIGRACFERDTTDILISLFVLFMYGGMIFGVFPGTPGVSWESHLFGFISGIGTAWFWRKK